MADALINFGYSTVATAPSPATSGTSLVVQAGEGARCPAVPFNAAVWLAGAQPDWAAGTAANGNVEIVRVTARSTDTLTITRAQEGTAARTIVVGDQVHFGPTLKYFTDSQSDISALQTQTAVQAAQIAAATRAATGYYVGQGCVYTPNATPTKLDATAGSVLIGTTDKATTAQTAISTTIASLADATNPKWVVVEIDTAGVTQFNQGTAANPPAVPAFTASRVPVYLIYVPANATNVDALLTTNNGLAKLIDIRIVNGGPSLTGWQYDQNTWKFGSATQFAVLGDVSPYLTKSTKVSYNDGAVDYGVVGAVSFLPAAPITSVSTTVATDVFNKTAHGLANGTAVVPTGLVNTTGLTNGTIYFVVSTAANTFKLALTIGGTAIDLTGADDSTVITITGATVVTLISTTDYTIANATLTAPRYSYAAANPQGFPTWFNWDPAPTGCSAVPTSVVYRWTTLGTTITCLFRESVSGTSNNATHTYGFPIVVKTLTNAAWINISGVGVNNAVANTVMGMQTVSGFSGGTVARLDTATGLYSVTMTASGAWRIDSLLFSYEF